MIDEAAAAVVTGAAGNIVAYMLSGRIDALRELCARVFRHATAQEQAEALHALDQDSAALARGEATQTEIAARWSVVLFSHLAEHPQAREEIGALAGAQGGFKSVRIGSQHNHGSGTFIGGDNYGGVNSGGGPSTA